MEKELILPVQTIQRIHNLYDNMNEAFLVTQEKNNSIKETGSEESQ